MGTGELSQGINSFPGRGSASSPWHCTGRRGCSHPITGTKVPEGVYKIAPEVVR